MLPRRLTLALLAIVLALSLVAVIVIALIERPGSPVGVPTVTPWFSPDGDGHLDVATIHFRMRHRDRVSVMISDSRGHDVQRVLAPAVRAGNVVATWDGRDMHGGRSPQGTYRARLDLHDFGRSITVPSPIHIDTTAPTIESIKLDATRVPTLCVVRVFATTRDAKTTELRLSGSTASTATGATTDATSRTLRITRSRPVDQSDGSTKDFLVATLPQGASPRPGAQLTVELTVRDHAGNSAARSASARVPTKVTLANGRVQPAGTPSCSQLRDSTTAGAGTTTSTPVGAK